MGDLNRVKLDFIKKFKFAQILGNFKFWARRVGLCF